MKGWRLAWRFLKRDLAAGEVRVLLAALALAVMAVTSVAFVTERAQRALAMESNRLLGGDVLLRADDIVHDDHAPVQAQIVRKSFRGSEFLYTLRLASGHTVLAHVPSHHDHALGEWIGIRAQVDHVVTFPRG